MTFPFYGISGTCPPSCGGFWRSFWILFLIAHLPFFDIAAQDRSFGTLPLVRTNQSRMADQAKVTGTPEYFNALEVFEKLVQARGDFRSPVPKFSLLNDIYKVAFIDYNQLEIVLEEKAYRVCESFGPQKEAAVAFLLGHELTHYYEKHAWRRAFIYDFRDLPIGQELAGLHDDVVHETEADYLGGFLAYSAGFGLFDKGSELIERLYAAYKLPDTISGYPTLQDRKILSLRSAEKLSQLVDLFEMANYLYAIGRYEDAIQYFAYVLQQYPSRELYNNLGVTALMSAVDLFSETEMKFKFFAELDMESSASRGGADTIQRTKYLQQAILHFDAAISLDPSYAPAYFNKAVAYALLKDIPRARFYAGVEAMNKSQSEKFAKTAKDIRILLALLDALEGQEQKAREELQLLAAQGQLMASINLDILNGKKVAPSKKTTDTKQSNRGKKNLMDQIVKALETGDELPVDTIITNRLSQHLSYHQSESKASGMKLKISQNSASNRSIVFLSMQNDPAPDPTLKIGADRQSILNVYGSAQHIVETPNGQLLVFKVPDEESNFSGRILVFDANAKLTRTVQFKEILN